MWSVGQIIRKVRVSLFGEETASYMDVGSPYVNIADVELVQDGESR